MNYRNIILSALLTLAVASCTCREEMKCYVKDSETKEPIGEVKVQTIGALKGNYKQGSLRYSDSNGRFVAAYDIGNIAKCPVMKLFISKEGYNDKIVIEPQEGDTIYINKIQL